MALSDIILKQISKHSSVQNSLKQKTAIIISIFAAIFSINAFIQNQTASGILNRTINASDTWAFYQAKSIKQTQYQITADTIKNKEDKLYIQYMENVNRYENEPIEGKKALYEKAKSIEAERDLLKKKSPWLGIAGSVMQISIVMVTASILSAGMLMFYAGTLTMLAAIGLMLQGIFLWI